LRQPIFPSAGRPSLPALVLLSVAVALSSAGLIALVRSAQARRAGFSGARWIWISLGPERQPLHFSAAREFTLDSVPPSVTARVFVDRRFDLWVNESRVGSGGERPGDSPATFAVTHLLKRGRNVVALVAESPDGVGGILFALDSDGGPLLVSDGAWRVDPTGRSVTATGGALAAVLGGPPLYPWGLPGKGYSLRK
jgi:hypothetical protein